MSDAAAERLERALSAIGDGGGGGDGPGNQAELIAKRDSLLALAGQRG